MTKKERSFLAEGLKRLCADIASIACALEDGEIPEQKQDPPAVESAPEPEKVYTFEEVRSILAEKSRKGFRAEVKGLLAKRNVEQLSDITDPNDLAALVKEAEGIGNG